MYVIPEAFIAVPIQTEPTFQAGVPQKLFFDGNYVRGGSRQFDITPDGSRFLMIRETQDVEQAEIHVVLNWTEELKRLFPTDN